MSDFDNLSTAELSAQISQLEEFIKTASAEFNHNQGEMTRVQALMVPLQEELQKLREKRNLAEAAMREIKPRIQDGRDELVQLKHEMTRRQLAELATKEAEKKFAEFDAATINAPWREWAFSHQIDGAKRIAIVGGRAILGDQRGLGKTLTSLITADMLGSKRIIIFAPKETLSNFEDEIKNWAKNRTLVSLAGKSKLARDMALDILRDTSQYILCINLEAWRKDKTFIPQLNKLQADTVIIDEAHYCKEPEGLAFQGVSRVVYARNKCHLCGENNFVIDGTNLVCSTKSCNGIYNTQDYTICSVKHVLPMSGTTILNRPQELWPLLFLIDRVSFPTMDDFLKIYCVKSGGYWRFKYGGEDQLIKKIGAQYIRRDRKSAGIKIPPQKIQHYELMLDPDKYPHQFKAYAELKHQWMLFAESGEAISINEIIVQLLRLRQLITWPMGISLKDPETGRVLFQCDVKESVKMDFCADLATELVLEEDERVIGFSQFVGPLKEWRRRLEEKNIRVAMMTGDTPDYLRAEIRRDFDRKTASETNYRWDVVLCHYKVGGQSINLTAATQTIVMDRQWNPGMEDQALGRNDRIGQTEETTVHMPHVLNTVDSWLNRLIEAKAELIQGFDSGVDKLMNEIMKGMRDGTI